MTKRIYSVLLVILMTVFTAVTGYVNRDAGPVVVVDEGLFHKKENIEIWYTDEALGDYLARAALQYYEEEGVRVVPTYVSGVQYLEQINDAQISGEMPRIYTLSAMICYKRHICPVWLLPLWMNRDW